MTPDPREWQDFRRLAEAATPGERHYAPRVPADLPSYERDGGTVYVRVEAPQDYYVVVASGLWSEADAAFVAACSPAAVLRLLNELDGTRTALETARHMLAEMTASRDRLAARVAELEGKENRHADA